MTRKPATRDVLFAGEMVRLERHEHGIRRVVLARPRARNALNARMVEEMAAVLGGLAQLDRPECFRLLVLDADGPVFCAGADLKHMREQADLEPDANLADAGALASMLRRLAAMPVPVLASLRGAAMGGGVGIVACADVAIAEVGVKLGLPEVRLGLLPAVIGPYLVRKIGISNATALTLSSRRFTAWEALAMGLVHRVVPAPDLAAATEDAVWDLLRAGPEAARHAKALMLQISPLPGDEIEQVAVSATAAARASSEGKAGLTAVLKKQMPPWVPERPH